MALASSAQDFLSGEVKAGRRHNKYMVRAEQEPARFNAILLTHFAWGGIMFTASAFKLVGVYFGLVALICYGVVRCESSRKAHRALRKKAKRGFGGYPVATIAFYGPDDKRASKVAVGIVLGEDQSAAHLRRWLAESADIRFDHVVFERVLEFVRMHAAKSVVLADQIIG